VFTNQLFNEFIKSRASGSSKKTLEIYYLTLGGFIGYPLTPEGINAYLNSLTCGNAKHNYYRCIKTLCRWLYHTNQLPSNPIEKVLPPRRQKRILPAWLNQFNLLYHLTCLSFISASIIGVVDNNYINPTHPYPPPISG